MQFDPIAQWGKVFETFQKLSGDTVTRTTAMFAEVEKAESKRIQQAETAIEEMAKLQKETLAYGVQLGAEFRKLSLEAIKNATAFAASAGSTTA